MPESLNYLLQGDLQSKEKISRPAQPSQRFGREERGNHPLQLVNEPYSSVNEQSRGDRPIHVGPNRPEPLKSRLSVYPSIRLSVYPSTDTSSIKITALPS